MMRFICVLLILLSVGCGSSKQSQYRDQEHRCYKCEGCK